MKWIKKLATFLIIVIALFCIESAKNIAQKEIREDALGYNDTLEKVAKNAPLPDNHMTGMNPVVNDENLYIEFYDDISVGNDKYLLCDWIDRDYKNELKATVINFNKEQDNGNITFSNMTVSDAKKYLYQWKNPPPEYKVENIKINYIDEGYFKVNGNVVLWLSAKIDQPEREKMMVFYYHVHKNRKTYMLSYFTTDFMNNQPNDVILTSLNTLRVK